MRNADSESSDRGNTSKENRRDRGKLAGPSASAAKETRSPVRSTPAKAYCAIDLGAESGRVVLVRVHNGILETQEVRRFANEPVRYGGSLHWDVPRLWLEIRTALRDVSEAGLEGIGVDAWGVDYALLGERGELLENPYHYRDSRTNGVMEELLGNFPREEIYRATGIQFMPINTLYQLLAAKRDTPRLLETAERLITIPDLFHYWLTGKVCCEFTNATTTQLVNAGTRSWDKALMERVGLPSRLPAAIAEPGSILGPALPHVVGGERTAPVILPGSHDTASAVAAISAGEGTAFLSSGTWSLVGMELDTPVITTESLRLNFTNEGGVNGTTRLLKNVMGLWIVQGCRKSWASRGLDYSYQELMEQAAGEPPFRILFDPDDGSFLGPEDMLAAIDRWCEKTAQPHATSPGAYARGALESLALKYRIAIENLEALTGKRIETIRVIGGGAKNRLLNQMTADATARCVVTGPIEAAALGNVAVQMVATGAVSSLREARRAIGCSFAADVYEPRETDRWSRQAERFRQYCGRSLCLQ